MTGLKGWTSGRRSSLRCLSLTPGARATGISFRVSNAEGVQEKDLQRLRAPGDKRGVPLRAKISREVTSDLRWTPPQSRSNRPVVRTSSSSSSAGCDGWAPGTAGYNHPGGRRLLPGDATGGLGWGGGRHPAKETVQLLHLLHGLLCCGVRGRFTQWQREQKQRHHNFGAPGGHWRGEWTAADTVRRSAEVCPTGSSFPVFSSSTMW